MKNKSLILLFGLLSVRSVVFPLEITSYGIDGSSGNPNVSIKDRSPVIHFEYRDGIVSFYEIKISSFYEGLSLSSTVWYVLDTTTTLNTLNNITRVECPANVLYQNTTYWFQISVYQQDVVSSSDTKYGWFYVTFSSAVLEKDVDLKVDFNNPFCPKQGEITKIKYMVKNKDMPVKLYIFSITGKHIKTLADHIALKDVVYTIDWDGTDNEGKILPQGIYLAIIQTSDLSSNISFVGIINKR
ncbi:MAG: hypothetical protein NZ839_02400 [Endomicrobia bacterium]|nr:hypothetical protein [Endomicrobiia bacterium]